MNQSELKAFVQGMVTNGGLVVNGVFGGEEMMEQTVLFETDIGNPASSGNLSDSISNYDLVYIVFRMINNGNTMFIPEIVLPQELLKNNSNVYAGWNWGSLTSSSNSMFTQTTFKINGSAGNSDWKPLIQKIIGLKFTSRINYSTEEQCIGTWIDGKPLYQKTVVAQNITSQKYGNVYGYLVADLTSLNIDTPVCVVNGNFKFSTWDITAVPFSSTFNQTESLNWSFAQGSLRLMHIVNGSNAFGSMKKITATIQYTKITD